MVPVRLCRKGGYYELMKKKHNKKTFENAQSLIFFFRDRNHFVFNVINEIVITLFDFIEIVWLPQNQINTYTLL